CSSDSTIAPCTPVRREAGAYKWPKSPPHQSVGVVFNAERRRLLHILDGIETTNLKIKGVELLALGHVGQNRGYYDNSCRECDSLHFGIGVHRCRSDDEKSDSSVNLDEAPHRYKSTGCVLVFR